MELSTKVVQQPYLDSLEGDEANSGVEAFLDDASYGQVEEIHDSQIGFKPGRPKLYKMLGTRADVINGNGRVYPRPVLTKMVREWKTQYGASGQLTGDPQGWGGSVGEEGHPQSYNRADGKLGWKSKTENKCIKVVDVLEPDEAGNVYFVFHTIGTQRGRDLQATLDAGDRIGCSMRSSGAGKRGKFGGRDVTIATRLELTTFDILSDPALSDTLGSAVPITDSQINDLLAAEEENLNFSDAVDPYIQRVKDAETIPALMKVSVEVEGQALDAVDRQAFEAAYYRRYYQIRQLEDAVRMEQSSNRIGYVDNQNPEGDETMKYTFEQLMKMTDADLQRARQEEPACAPICDAIMSQRNTEKELQVLRDAEEKRKSREAAQAFMDSQDIKDKLSKLPSNVQSIIRSKVDLTDAETAQRTFTDAYDVAIELAAGDRLKNKFNLDTTKPIVDHLAPTGDVYVGENRGWMEIADKIQESANDYRKRKNKLDTTTAEINKPIMDALLASFDEDNAATLNVFADNFSETTSTMTVLNGSTFYRSVIVQAFQTMIALNYVETGTFRGEFANIPNETYKRVNSTPTRGREGKSKAKGILDVGYLSVAAESRELIAKVTNQALNFMKSGPIAYDVLGRLAFHLGEDIKREASLDIHNEMLLSADEYNAAQVTNELSDISADRRVVTLLRGGETGNPNKDVPILRPRYGKDLVNGQKIPRVYNELKLTVGGEPVDLEAEEAFIDYENGQIVFSDPLPAGEPRTDYAYVTNIAIFSMTPTNGVTVGEHWKTFIHLFGGVVSNMAESPIFYKPDFSFASLTLANNISQADSFEAWKLRQGTSLAPNGWVADIHNVETVSHNEPWYGGDTRMLLGTRGGSKYYVESQMQIEPPQPGRDENGDYDGSKDIYLYTADALVTPIKKQFRTIKFVK